MSDKGEKSIKVIYFTGKSQGWCVWNKKFLAHANRLSYKKLLLEEEAIPTETEIQAINNKTVDKVTLTDEKNLELYQLNERAYKDLLLSIDGESKQGRVAFNLVENAVTPDNPEGNCKIVWDRLVNKYAPKMSSQGNIFDCASSQGNIFDCASSEGNIFDCASSQDNIFDIDCASSQGNI